ncbi:hypothetical protein BDF19DRAFT_437148 [Syncephalis fuscata]|nr:hypothetical protein BDF19DRAFT_437148 [Syncephalis fuscata]
MASRIHAIYLLYPPVFYLITLALYLYQFWQCPKYFKARSPWLTVCASIIGLVITAFTFLRQYSNSTIPCQVMLWVNNLGFIAWQALMVTRTYRLFWTMRRHSDLVKAAPWQVNNTGYLDASLEKKYKDRTSEWRSYSFLIAMLIIAAVVIITVQAVGKKEDKDLNRSVNNTRRQLNQDDGTEDNHSAENSHSYWAECHLPEWHRYPLLVIWGIVIVYTVFSGLFKPSQLRENLIIRLELIAIYLITIVIYVCYIVWCAKDSHFTMRWPCAMYVITHIISVVVPLYEVWRRRRLIHKVTSIEFDEALERNDSVWHAFQRYAAFDLCAESVCFIESYRKLMAQVNEHKETLFKKGTKSSIKAHSRLRRGFEETDQLEYENTKSSSSLPSSSPPGYTQRVFQRLRRFTLDSVPPSTTSENNQLVCVSPHSETSDSNSHQCNFPSADYGITAIPPSPASLSRVMGLSTTNESSSEFKSPHNSMESISRASEASLKSSNSMASLATAHQLPRVLIPAYRGIFETYIRDGATLQLNITYAAKTNVTNRVREYAYTFDMYDEIYAEIKWSLWTNTFPRFIETYRQDLTSANIATV